MRTFAALAMLAVVAGCSAPAATPGPTTTPGTTLAASPSAAESHVLTGSFTLNTGAAMTLDGKACRGEGGYDDIAVGAPVIVTNEASVIVASGALAYDAYTGGGACRFVFSIGHIPHATFYGVEVSHRGKVTLSFDDMAGKGWSVAFTLG